MASNLELPAEHGVRIVAEGIRASVMDLQQRDRVVALKGDFSAEETARGSDQGDQCKRFFVQAREAVRAMLEGARGGVIVNVASVVSVVRMKETVADAASKGAIAQLTKVIAVEYGGQGIRANAIGAGVIETGILDGIVANSRATSTTVLQRLGLILRRRQSTRA